LATPASPAVVIEGHAIVSADGMIAEADGGMPSGLRNEADWGAFQTALDRSALVVLGRLGHARHPNPGRHRLVLTRSVARLARDPGDPLATLWNPKGAAFVDVLAELDIATGTIAVTGGTGVFDHFLTRFDRFVLAEVHGLVLPGGTPCFSAGHPRAVLAGVGLHPGLAECIDPAAAVSATLWERPPRR
jgi:hypothetical protein